MSWWRWCSLARVVSGPMVVALAFGILGACNVLTHPEDISQNQNNPPQSVIDKIRSLDLLPRFSREPASSSQPKGSRPAVYEGGRIEAAPEHPAAASGDGFDLNFENTAVSTVARVILGDILGVGYSIDPRVQGTVSLASGRPVPKSDMLFVLESVLRTSGVALVRDTGGYRLVPATEAVGGGTLDRQTAQRRTEPGFGISVIRLRHVSAATIMKILDGFGARTGALRVDPGRNMLIVQGSGPERRAVMETVSSFDVDWLRGQSVGIYPVRNSTPEPLIAELEKIVDSAEGGLSHNVVKLQPINRLNAIMVVTRRADLLRTVATWISRLDTADTTATGVRVYRVRYGDARQMARLLNEMFVGGGSADAPSASPLAPSAGAITSTSGPSVSRPALSNAPQAPPGADPQGRIDAGAAPVRAGGGTGTLPGVRITADVGNNNLLIFANQESYRIIERTLRQLDRPQLQVAIEATIAEVTLNDTLNYGVQFFLKSSDLGLGKDSGSIINTIGGAVLARQFPGFNLLIGSQAEPRFILDALHKVSDVKVLSNPSVVVLDNQVATLQVGDSIPVTTGTATVINSSNQVVSTIDYRNTGIILRVVPRVNFNGNVVLDIEQEISNVASTDPTLTPTVSQRRVKSSIAVASGQTVLLAGLISERRDKGRSGIPVLNQIPGLGDLFSHQAGTAQRIELIMFIRPQVIRDSVDAHYVAEELRTRMGGQRTTVAPSTPVPRAGTPQDRR